MIRVWKVLFIQLCACSVTLYMYYICMSNACVHKICMYEVVDKSRNYFGEKFCKQIFFHPLCTNTNLTVNGGK